MRNPKRSHIREIQRDPKRDKNNEEILREGEIPVVVVGGVC